MIGRLHWTGRPMNELQTPGGKPWVPLWVVALVTGHVPCGSPGCAEMVTRDTGTRGHGNSKPRRTSHPPENTVSLHLSCNRGCQSNPWMAARTSLEEGTPDAVLLHSLSFIINRLGPTVAYRVNLSISWRLWSLSGGHCWTNKDFQKGTFW